MFLNTEIQYTEIQYTEIQKYPCIETWRFKNFHVLFTQMFFLKANNSVKSQQMMKIFKGVNQGTGYYQFIKNRVRKSHDNVP